MTKDTRFTRDPEAGRALSHSVQDGVAYSVMAGSGESYFSAFALHFKATATDVGILATLPPLIGSFFQLLSVALARVMRNRRHIILLGALLQILSWLPLTLLPSLYPRYALLIILGSLILFYGAGNLITPAWTSLMGDLVPERKRGRYFAHRSRLSSLTGLVALVAAGVVLQHFSDSTAVTMGFVIIFAIAAVARMVSAYHLWRMYEPPLEQVRLPSLGESWDRWRGTTALRFSAYFSLVQFSVAIAGPFFAVFMLRDLGFNYLELMTNTAISVLVQFLTLRSWGRIGDTFGHRFALVLTGFCMPAIPALWLLSGNYWYLLGVQAVSGVLGGGFVLSANNILFDLVPREERIQYLASHNVLAGVSIFAGSMVGGWLAATLPAEWGFFKPISVLGWLFLFSAVLRLIISLGFLPRVRETREVRPFSWYRLVCLFMGSRRCMRRRSGRVRVAPKAIA